METKHAGTRVVAVIPTKNRRELARAVSSVHAQSLLPDLLVIVGEAALKPESIRCHGGATKAATSIITNEHAGSLSGAINTALAWLVKKGFEPESTHVAFLDDDDWWAPEYLQKCFSLARAHDLDWVVPGITRHEKEGGGTDLSIPHRIVASDFLFTNPHIQGSNLFVRLSTLMRAGCFDENLPSTTDRDVCARLAYLGDVRVGFVREHLVHHMAAGNDRLSSPGNMKRLGLVAFHRKYGPLMSSAERDRFLDRAITVFRCEANDFEPGVGEAH